LAVARLQSIWKFMMHDLDGRHHGGISDFMA
jgi:hypothetical protein